MRLTISTWNINSVRLRINLVAKFIKAMRPDVLCLQETKCPDDAFPLKRFQRLSVCLKTRKFGAVDGTKQGLCHCHGPTKTENCFRLG